jgi:Acetyltransferase (GNAT) domain
VDKIKTRIATTDDLQAVDMYLESQNGVPPLASSDYSDVLRASYPVDTPTFIAFDTENHVTGILTTYLRRDASLRRELYSPPYGLVVNDDKSAALLMSAMENYCRDNDVVRTTINSGLRQFEFPCERWPKTTIIKQLAGTSDDVWSGFRAKTRNMIRKAEKNSVVMQQGVRYLQQFYDAYATRMTELGLSIHSLTYFENLLKKMGDKVKLFVAVQGECVLGGMIFVFGPGVAFYHYNASNPKGRSLGINDFLVWEVIKHSMQQGIDILDLSEATPGSPVYNFKTREVGGSPQDTYYYDILCSACEAPTSVSRPLAYRLGRRILPYLPKPLRRRLLIVNKKIERII